MQASELLKNYRSTRADITANYRKELDNNYEEYTLQARKLIAENIGKQIGYHYASDILAGGTCVFGNCMKQAKMMVFHEDTIIVIDFDGKEHDIKSLDLGIINCLRIADFLQTGHYSTIEPKLNSRS